MDGKLKVLRRKSKKGGMYDVFATGACYVYIGKKK